MKIEDVILVGSGPGSSISAKTLADAGMSVLIIEEGDIPNHKIAHHSVEEVLTYYRNGGILPSVGMFPVNMVDVSVVGGASTVNSGIYHDIPVEVLHLLNFNAEEKKLFSAENLSLKIRNLLHIDDTPTCNFGDRLMAASSSLGLSSRILPRWSTSLKKLGTWDHRHHSVFESILKPNLSANLQIIPNHKVVRLKRIRDHWEVICLDKENRVSKVFKSKIVVLGAGAIGTPTILRLSNLSKSAGNILRFHPMKRYTFTYPKDSYDFSGAVFPFQITQYLPKITIGCSLSDRGSIFFWNPELFGKDIFKNNDLVSHYVLIVPEVPARIHFKLNKVVISHRFSESDWVNFKFGYSVLSRLAIAAGSEGIFLHGQTNKIVNSVNSLADTARFKGSVFSSIHQYGSCHFGDSEKDSVIDQNFQVWGQENLYACDSSTIPIPIGVNPQGTVASLSYIFSQRALDLWKSL
jgi:long-chain-alcohol oxidase